MNSHLRIPMTIAAGALLASSLAGIEVTIDFDPSVDFGELGTIGWLPGTPAADPLVERRIRATVERELVGRGFKEVRENPDVLLVTHTSLETEKQIDVAEYDYWIGYEGWKRPTAVSAETWNCQVGTVIVDILDASSQELIWRGVATGSVAKKAKNRDEKLDQVITKLFKRFPPK